MVKRQNACNTVERINVGKEHFATCISKLGTKWPTSCQIHLFLVATNMTGNCPEVSSGVTRADVKPCGPSSKTIQWFHKCWNTVSNSGHWLGSLVARNTWCVIQVVNMLCERDTTLLHTFKHGTFGRVCGLQKRLLLTFHPGTHNTNCVTVEL